MTPAALAVSLALAAVALSAAAGSLFLALVEYGMRRLPLAGLGARARASLLMQARLAPLTLSLVLVPLVQLAFWKFEPPHATETTGLALPLLALSGALVLGVVARRGWRSVHATMRVAQAWRQAGELSQIPGWQGRAWIVHTGFPVVAVVGVDAPKLDMSADVVRACSPREIAAIAAHERAHVVGRDNLTRVLFALAPAAGRAAARLERAWAATAEEIADLHARAAGDGVTLAQALTKVARLAAAPAAAPPLAMSAFVGGDNLEGRVRRLLEPPQAAGPALRGLPLAVVAPAALGAVIWGLPAIYHGAEFLVTLGR